MIELQDGLIAVHLKYVGTVLADRSAVPMRKANVCLLLSWQEHLDLAEQLRKTRRGKEIYSLRKETIERVFADAKQKHGLRYTLHRGLARVTNWVRLKFAATNLKKLALWCSKSLRFSSFNLRFFLIPSKLHFPLA